MNIKTINMKKLKEFYNKSSVNQDIISGAFFGMLNIIMAYMVMQMILISDQLYTAYRIFIDFIS
mgnify:CR=1 FL=1